MPSHGSKLQALIDDAIKRQIASSISLWVGNTDKTLVTAYAGNAETHTVYDLASLTKILGTTLALSYACADGILNLNDKPIAAWPEQSIRDLLAHRSGHVAHRHFYNEAGVKEGLWDHNECIMRKALYAEKPKNPPGQVRLYSDLNFLALGDVLTAKHKTKLMDIFEATWLRCGFNKAFRYFASGTQRQENAIAPTGWCKVRQAKLCGQVHDLNCYFLGGLSGHAGLFGTLDNTAWLAQFFLRCYHAPKNAGEAMLGYFMRLRLGFDHPTPDGSVRFLSPQSFGHFGFTGVSVWIDPRASGQGQAYVLLTNRVAQSSDPKGIFWLREQFHRLASS